MALALNDNDPRKPGVLNYVGDIFWKRYKAGYRPGDLEGAISSYDRTVRLTPDFDPEQSMRLVNLGLGLYTRFQSKGNRADIEIACFCFEGSLLNKPRNANACGWMKNLGCALSKRFENTGDLSDLTRALDLLQHAVELTPDDHPNKPVYLNELGSALQMQFDRLGHISDLDTAISAERQAVKLTPGDHVDRPRNLNTLSKTLQAQFSRFGHVSDLEESIFVSRKVVELTSDDHHDKPGYLNTLVNALKARFNRFGDVSDLEEATIVSQRVVELIPEGHPDKPRYWDNLGNTLQTRFYRFGNVPDLEKTVVVSQKAVKLTADGHRDKPSYLINLGNALEARFTGLGDVSDLEKAISLKRQAVKLTPEGHPSKGNYLSKLGNSLQARFSHLGDISDLETAISVKQQAVKLTPDGHPDMIDHLNNLANTFQTRFYRLEDVSDLEEAIVVARKVVELTPEGHPDKHVFLHNLGNGLEVRFDRLGDVSDLETAISFKQQATNLTSDGHSDKPGLLNSLGHAFLTRFNHLEHLPDLQSAIDVMQQSVELTPDENAQKPYRLSALAAVQLRQFRHHNYFPDFVDFIETISTVALSINGAPRLKFDAARLWSELSEEQFEEDQTILAYECALGLIPRVAWMGLEIEGRHRELEQIGELVRKAAGAATRYGHYDQALEWLEQGRSVVWGQTLQLRSPLDLLREMDPIRADRLTEISHDLQFNGESTALSDSDETRGDRLRALVLEWDALISAIRKVKGFEDFLGPKKVTQLLTAAASFPIVVLNTHEAGCDALVLVGDADGVRHIRLTLTSERARKLLESFEKIKSQHSRGRSIEPIADRGFKIAGSEHYDQNEAIKGLLAELWKAIVKPVLDALALELPSDDCDELPRICWCPTGPIAFLPIHAAGIYNSDERGTKVFDYVVSSYTPTVSALLQPPPTNPGLPTIFAVAQAQQSNPGFSTLPSTKEEIWFIGQRAVANSINLVVAEDGAGTVQRVLDEMAKCKWVHLACHGTQDLDDPTKSAFVLADGNLELSEIIKHPLPDAEFAFLSACETATGDVKLAEEAVHLAAGMMLAGYRSVIATMWSIRDKDGPDVADAMYAEMLKDGKADYTRAAYALHRAVQKLRLSGAPLMAWMPFIHMGR